jgi:hypothetical protein
MDLAPYRESGARNATRRIGKHLPIPTLRAWLRIYAKAHPRCGFHRAYHDARGEGWTVNHKKIQRRVCPEFG